MESRNHLITKELIEGLKTITREENGHWLTSLEPNSSGHVRLNVKRGVLMLVHRISASYFMGLDYDDKDKLALHKCDKPGCWNPEHLYIGTKGQNLTDSYRAGRMNHNSMKAFCKRGHKFTTENTKIRGDGSRLCLECYKRKLKGG